MSNEKQNNAIAESQPLNMGSVSGLLPSDSLLIEWEKCKIELKLKGSAGEMGIYFGMFMHGWRGRNSEGFWQ